MNNEKTVHYIKIAEQPLFKTRSLKEKLIKASNWLIHCNKYHTDNQLQGLQLPFS